MAGKQIFKISKAHSARGPDESSGDYISVISFYFAVTAVMVERLDKVTEDGKSLMPGVHHDLQ
jgi:hypothetical protein